MSKITIIGAGKVGSTVAQLCAYENLTDIVLLDNPAEIARGVALDLMQSAPIEHFDVDVTGTGDYADIEDSEIICVTAGIRRTPGISRSDLLNKNAEVIIQISKKIAAHAPKSKIIVVTNPLDSMTLVAKKATEFPRERVLGMAGVLDSARFKSFIATESGKSVSDVSAMVVGSHGDYMVPLLSHSSVSGVPLAKLLSQSQITKIVERTRNAGAEILSLQKQSSAHYAPASSVVQMINAILNDTRETLPASVYLDGEYGCSGICIGVPIILGRNGMEKIVELDLNEDERKQFQKSAEAVRVSISKLGYG